MTLATPGAVALPIQVCAAQEGCLRSQSFLHTPTKSHSCFFLHLADKSICVYREVESIAHGINICVCVCVCERERERERERAISSDSDMLDLMKS